eukprot:scaffold17726_cov53-Cyclotella_meneghiniana.AAC.2
MLSLGGSAKAKDPQNISPASRKIPRRERSALSHQKASQTAQNASKLLPTITGDGQTTLTIMSPRRRFQ